jgi:hypothetical protein
MRRREVLAAITAGGLSGLAGCGILSSDCPDNPIVDKSILAARRSLRFLSDDNYPKNITPPDPPTIRFDETASAVIIQGVMSGSPKSRFPKNMIVVDRLAYNEQEDTLHIRLRKRQCKSSGAGIADSAAYELRVTFPEQLPGEVCAQEGGGFLASEESIERKCVSR